MPLGVFGTKVQCPALCQISDTPGVLAWPVDTPQKTPCTQRGSTSRHLGVSARIVITFLRSSTWGFRWSIPARRHDGCGLQCPHEVM